MAPNVQETPEVPSDEVPLEEEGRKEIYYEGYFYDVTNWIRRHPGGKIIQFYTQKGEDATIPIQEFHKRSDKKVMAIMKGLNKRAATPQELGLDEETTKRHAALTNDFKKLTEELENEGFFQPSIPHVIYRISELLFLLLLGLYLLTNPQSMGAYVVGTIGLGLFMGRCGWLMHEGGHHSLTGVPKVDRFLQAVVFGCGVGLSSIWWSSQHNRHHAFPQRLQHDVDLETLPLIAFNKRVVKDKKQGQGFFVQHQSTLFLLIDNFLVAIIWKFYLHPRYIIRKGSYTQLIFMGLHYMITFHVGFFPYIISVWLGSLYLFGNFALSHTHLPVTDKPIHWVEYSFLHTTDIEPSWWCDWWMGYLNYQIEHHLYPTMPQFRHPQIRGRIMALAKKHNIPYHCSTYVGALNRTLENLAEVSRDIKAT